MIGSEPDRVVYRVGGQSYVADLLRLTQTNVSTNKTRKLKRIELPFITAAVCDGSCPPDAKLVAPGGSDGGSAAPPPSKMYPGLKAAPSSAQIEKPSGPTPFLVAARVSAGLAVSVGVAFAVRAIYVGHDLSKVVIDFVSYTGVAVGQWIITEAAPLIFGSFIPYIGIAIGGIVGLAKIVRAVTKWAKGDATGASVWDEVVAVFKNIALPIGIAVGGAALLLLALPGLPIVAAVVPVFVATGVGLAIWWFSDAELDAAYKLLGCGKRDSIATIADRVQKKLQRMLNDPAHGEEPILLQLIPAYSRVCLSRDVLPRPIEPAGPWTQLLQGGRRWPSRDLRSCDMRYFQSVLSATNINRCPRVCIAALDKQLAKLDQLGQPNPTYRSIEVREVQMVAEQQLPVMMPDPECSHIPTAILERVLESEELIVGPNHLLLFRGSAEGWQNKAFESGSFYVGDPGALSRGIYLTDNAHKATNYCKPVRVSAGGRTYDRCVLLATVVDVTRMVLVGRGQRDLRASHITMPNGVDAVLAPRVDVIRSSEFHHNEVCVLARGVDEALLPKPLFKVVLHCEV